MKHTITIALAAAALAASAISAQAGCADPRAAGASAAPALSAAAIRTLNPNISLPPPPLPGATQNIVGSWLVTYTSGGQPFGQALIQWHDDGTEWENINLPLSGGNICVGSWKPIDNLHVTRFHVGWLYTNGILSGYFTETETDNVRRNDYRGVNDTKIFDLNGTMLAEVPGTSSAVRFGP